MIQPVAADGLDPIDDAAPSADADDPVDPLDAKGARLPFGTWLAGGWLVLLAVVSVFADLLPLNDPNAQVASVPRLAPGQEGLLLGADANGRDMLARLVYGGRVSLMISVGSVLIGFLVGGLLGLIAGFYRNWVSRILASLFDIMLSIPALVLTLALVAVLKGSPTDTESFKMDPALILVLALGVVSIPLLARITRANTMSWAQREFVTAARAQGATGSRILFREILPNVLPAMVYISLLGMGIAMVAEGGLALLGASVEAPQATWGTMINLGRADMRDAPFIMFFPIIAVFLTVLSMNYLSDVVRDRFDVRESAL